MADVRVTKRTPGMIVPDGQVHGRFFEPGEIATGTAAAVILEWGCGEVIAAKTDPVPGPVPAPVAPPADGLDDLTVAVLRERAAAAAIDAAGLKKAELIEVLRAVAADKPVA